MGTTVGFNVLLFSCNLICTVTVINIGKSVDHTRINEVLVNSNLIIERHLHMKNLLLTLPIFYVDCESVVVRGNI